MLGNSKVITTIAVHDIENAREFYEKTLGLKLATRNIGGLIFECGSGQIAIYESPMAGSGQATCAWWTVDDVEATVNELKAKGIVFDTNYDLPYARREGDIYILGENAKAVWFKDPDGNILGLGNF